MRTTRRNGGKALKALTLSFALAAVFTGTASSMARDHAASRPEIPYLSHGQGIPEGTFDQVPGGVTPATLARAYSDGFDRDDVAIGFGLGLVLATACAATLAAARGRVRMAHS